MRKLSVIFFTLIFLFNNECSYLLFRILQHKVQKEVAGLIHKGIKEEDLTQIILPLSDQQEITWVKINKEFRYHNHLYDVVFSRSHDQHIHYYCVNDQKEMRLFAASQKLNDTKKQFDKKIKNSTSDRYLPCQFLLNDLKIPALITYSSFDIPLVSNPLRIPSPPPKTA